MSFSGIISSSEYESRQRIRFDAWERVQKGPACTQLALAKPQKPEVIPRSMYAHSRTYDGPHGDVLPARTKNLPSRSFPAHRVSAPVRHTNRLHTSTHQVPSRISLLTRRSKSRHRISYLSRLASLHASLQCCLIFTRTVSEKMLGGLKPGLPTRTASI